MQRIDGNAQSPLQLARVDETVDPDFDPSVAVEVIERGSAVHCVSAFEGDVVILGSDGVFDNLFIDEILTLCEQAFPPSPAGSRFEAADRSVLGQVARRIVEACHAKTRPVNGVYQDTPIGRGGKIDDTSCVVGEVVEWTDSHGKQWEKLRKQRWWRDLMSCGGAVPSCGEEVIVAEDNEPSKVRNYPAKPSGSFSTYYGSFQESGSGSFNSSSAANIYGRKGVIAPGEAAYPGGRPMRQPPRRPRDDYDEDDSPNCSIM
jgi:hypothetical protein